MPFSATSGWCARFSSTRKNLKTIPELNDVQRTLYDYMLALGTAWKEQDAEAYLRQAKKKLSKLRQATDDFVELQPEVSTHMNFQMAVRSLKQAVGEIEALLANCRILLSRKRRAACGLATSVSA